jgi:hypothetical protein
MVFHMKTTLIIPDQLVRLLKRVAAETGRTLSDVVADTLRRGLGEARTGGRVPALPVHRMGKPRVDLSDRDELYRAMEGR